MQEPTRALVDGATAEEYRAAGWWSDRTVADAVAAHAVERPDAIAYVFGEQRSSWAQLDRSAERLAAAFVAAAVRPGDRVAVWLADSPTLHLVFLALEKAGVTIVGIGARAGRRELVHLLRRTSATALVTAPVHGDVDTASLVAGLRDDDLQLRHVVVDGAPQELAVTFDGELVEPGDEHVAVLVDRRMGPDDLYLINSTSGTTGLPKCVQHTQNRWHYFHKKAVANGALSADDTFLAVVPAPFGFGLWTSHVTPMLLGARTVLLDRFSPEAAFEAIERERVTVLCCVSTQFIMMLASPGLTQHDLSSLRVMFTGGEAVPYERALEFERATGATILQFYGSNETGLLSGTTLEDPAEVRLRTAGMIAPEMHVRLFDGDRDVTDTGRGQPACKGPATSLGYLDDDEANRQLFTSDGWMLMGDICEIDDDGYLTVVGRTSDFIIRGGKNISSAQVESDVATHPSVAHAAAVAMPDPVFGERVCVYVELIDDATLELDQLVEHLASQGVSKELYPERLIVLDELPRSSGAKVAKGDLRADIRRRVEAERTTAGTGSRTPDEARAGAH